MCFSQLVSILRISSSERTLVAANHSTPLNSIPGKESLLVWTRCYSQFMEVAANLSNIEFVRPFTFCEVLLTSSKL